MTSTAGTDRPGRLGARSATLIDLLRHRAERHPTQLGFRFLPGGEALATTLSYGELHRRAQVIAATLQSLHARGDRVLLVYPPGLELISAFLGCLYARSVAVVVPPPTPARLERFLAKGAAICRDAAPTVVLTTPEVERLLAGTTLPPELSALRWQTTDAEAERSTADWFDPAAGPDDLAFLQYTSGSTTEPRGVMVTHRNLMENLGAIQRTFRQTPDTESVCWLPPYHDMGLVGGILAPLYLGNPATLFPPVAFVQRPGRWLQAMSRYRATASGGPNFGYELCVRRVTPAQCEGLELGAWEVAFTGAEPVDPATLRRFADRFAPHGFHPAAFKPCYGLAEATLLVAAPPGRIPPSIRTFRAEDLQRGRARTADIEAGGVSLPSCGTPVEQVAIADPETRVRCAPGVVGEIWVSGPSVTRNYWQPPGDAGTPFGALFAGTTAPLWLRTGDLGFLLDGELFVTGRLKDLIIVDGANHYPQDLERTAAAAHPALDTAEAAAFSVSLPGREGVVLVVAPHRRTEWEPAELRQAIRAAIAAAHEIRLHEVVLVRTGRLPKTTSGKIRRALCRSAYLEGTLERWEQP